MATKNEEQVHNAKEARLEIAIAAIDKAFGKGTMTTLDNKDITECESIPTGSLALDKALGVGGFPKGRVVEIFGSESSAKTTLCLHAVANVQKAGGIAAYIDVEHALKPEYTQALGVNIKEMRISQPEYAEQALNIVEHLIKSGVVDLVIVDSVAALVPKAELEGSMDEQQIGLQARLMSKALRKLTGVVSTSNSCLVFINQTRTNIGQFFGDPTTTSGGNALKFYASVRIKLARTGWVKEKDIVIGSSIKAIVVKNKVAAPYRVCEFPVISDHGISTQQEVLDLALSYGIITKSGAWLSHDGVQVGQGKGKAREALYDNDVLYQKIKAEVVAKLAE